MLLYSGLEGKEMPRISLPLPGVGQASFPPCSETICLGFLLLPVGGKGVMTRPLSEWDGHMCGSSGKDQA